MKKRITALLSAVSAVILLFFTSAFASSAADDGLKNVDGKWIYVKDGVKDTSFTSLVKYYGTCTMSKTVSLTGALPVLPIITAQSIMWKTVCSIGIIRVLHY